MSDVRDGRGPDRRERGRRDVDRTTHLLEQGVIAAAMRWRNAQGGELDVVDTAERIDAARNLRSAVDNLEEFGGMDGLDMEAGGATADAIMGLAVVAVALTPRSILPTASWVRLLAVVVALAIVVIVAGMRRDAR